MDRFIEVKKLTKSFGAKEIFTNLDYYVKKNEIVSLIGQSGTGKSVLLKHFIGIIKPDSGNIFIDGEALYNENKQINQRLMDRMGILFQGAALFDSLNVFENISFGLERRGKSAEEIDSIVGEVSRSLGLESLLNKRIADLSGGIQKRVGLARAIVLKPDVMLYDEPTTGVDPITAGVVDDLIVKMRDLYGTTSIVVTHDIASACNISDRIMMLHRGEIIFSGTADELRSSSDEAVVNFARD